MPLYLGFIEQYGNSAGRGLLTSGKALAVLIQSTRPAYAFLVIISSPKWQLMLSATNVRETIVWPLV
jgi:hypothetical protein